MDELDAGVLIGTFAMAEKTARWEVRDPPPGGGPGGSLQVNLEVVVGAGQEE